MITGKRDSHEEKEFNLLKIKIDLGEKQKQNHHPLFTFSQAQLCSSCTTLLLRWHRGMWGWGSTLNSSLLPFLSPHTFPLFQCVLLHGLQLPLKHVYLLQHRVLHGLHGNMSFTLVLFTGWGESLRGIFALAAGSAPASLSSLSLVSTGLSLTLFPSLLTLMQCFALS